MKKIKDSIYSAIANVQTAFPSVFTKEDVVSILEGLHTEIDSEEENETVSASTLDEDAINQIANEVADELGGLGIDLISDYDLSMSYREVELDSADIDEDRIKSAVKEAIQNYIDSLVEEEEG